MINFFGWFFANIKSIRGDKKWSQRKKERFLLLQKNENDSTFFAYFFLVYAFGHIGYMI